MKWHLDDRYLNFKVLIRIFQVLFIYLSIAYKPGIKGGKGARAAHKGYQTMVKATVSSVFPIINGLWIYRYYFVPGPKLS